MGSKPKESKLVESNSLACGNYELIFFLFFFLSHYSLSQVGEMKFSNCFKHESCFIFNDIMTTKLTQTNPCNVILRVCRLGNLGRQSLTKKLRFSSTQNQQIWTVSSVLHYELTDQKNSGLTSKESKPSARKA